MKQNQLLDQKDIEGLVFFPPMGGVFVIRLFQFKCSAQLQFLKYLTLGCKLGKRSRDKDYPKNCTFVMTDNCILFEHGASACFIVTSKFLSVI